MARIEHHSTGSRRPARVKVPPIHDQSMPSAREMIAVMRQPRVYVNAVAAVLVMIRQSIITGIISLAVTLLFAAGFFWTGKSPAKQTSVEFLMATMGNVHLCLAFVMLFGYTTPLSRYKWIEKPDMPQSYFRWLVRLFRATSLHYIGSVIGIVSLAWLSTSLDPTWQRYQVHFYVGSLVIHYYTASVDVISKRMYQTQTVEGVAKGHVNRSPFWRRMVIAYVNNFGYILVVFLSAAYIHLTSSIHIVSQESLLLFSFGSMSVRFVMMRIIRYIVLQLKSIHVRALCWQRCPPS